MAECTNIIQGCSRRGTPTLKGMDKTIKGLISQREYLACKQADAAMMRAGAGEMQQVL